MLVCLRDVFAQTIAHAATLRYKLETKFLSHTDTVY